MIIDSSALVAILKDEPEAESFALAIASADHARMSAANWLEAAIVVDSAHHAAASRRFDQLIATTPIERVAITTEHAEIARAAYRDYGKGSGHRAQLSLGDCFAYALAIAADEPLLFKGDDFGHTDVRRA